MIGIVTSIGGEQVRQRLGGAVPARTVGAILVTYVSPRERILARAPAS